MQRQKQKKKKKEKNEKRKESAVMEKGCWKTRKTHLVLHTILINVTSCNTVAEIVLSLHMNIRCSGFEGSETKL